MALTQIVYMENTNPFTPPTGFNLFRDAYLVILLENAQGGGHTVRRTCLGTEANVVCAVVAAMAKEPAIRDVLLKAVQLYVEHPDIEKILRK